ncbi:uncharacterized protein J3R85_007200 [Psidium guajava]|nr:uncharacterized protein J3R85_007200 [Psidium guajava]
MATDGAKAPGGEEEAVDDEWQHVESPDSPPSPHLPPSSSSTTQWDTNDGVVGRDDSLQFQQRRSSSVFPPLHPEGLDRLPPPHTPTSPPPSSSPSSPSASSSSPSPPNGTENEPPSPPLPSRPPAGILGSGIYGIASRVRHGLLLVGGCWSFGSAAAAAGVVAAILLSLAYVRRWRRWWRRDRVPVDAGENRLLLLIRDKDQKISQLLLQIAQMNELIVARRRVQVLRVGG